MSETICKWDRERETYLRNGEPCRTDDYGDPTRHCTARRTCANHIGYGELTCARCIGRTRGDIRAIVLRSAELMPAALHSGVNSQAANLAGPGANYRDFSARRALNKRWIIENIHQPARNWCSDEECSRRHFKTSEGDRWHTRGLENALADLIEDDDEQHPYIVLTRWAMMLAEDYSHDLPDVLTIDNAAAYLERTLPRMAQDDEQDFPLFAREIRRCRSHIEAVLLDSTQPERGAPCPECRKEDRVVRMVREYGHWCWDDDCDRIHYLDDKGDRWVCPHDRDHWRSHEDYVRWIEERKVGA